MTWWLAWMACGGQQLIVKWSFENIQEGYDHDNRMDVYVDGTKVAESEVAPESQPGTLKVSVPPGSHDVRVVAMALYEGSWEEHTVANDYSIDCAWTGTVKGNSREKLALEFDIEDGTKVKKAP